MKQNSPHRGEKAIDAPRRCRDKEAMFAPKIRNDFLHARPSGGAAGAITQAWLWWRDIPSAAASMRLW
jgi:hypothetical protein